ncbi:MAG: hypothetical protein JWN73_2338 [Betaproteobacteria bacterium]|nr:hypothetical protein [Betaproteobacteria bacterium]
MDKAYQSRFVHEVVPRLTRRWSDGVWIGCVFRAVAATEKLHAHYIAAAWEPPPAEGPPLITRLPDATFLAPHEGERALLGLIESLPARAKLFLAGPQHVDPALVTQVVLSADRNLTPALKEALAAFVGAEQARNEHSIRETYTDRDEAFEAFKRKIFGEPGSL